MNSSTKQCRGLSVLILLVCICALLAAAAPCPGCFSFVVGKDASADGCVLVAHNEDDGPPQIVNHHKVPRRRHPRGAMVKLRNGGLVEQAGQTWAYLWSEMPGMRFSDSYVNEWGVTVTSDNCPSREDQPEISEGGIGYMLRRLVAERAPTAREGVLLAGRLVERFGYIDSGRTYIIADPNEGWLCCVVNGKHWLARRVGDGEVAMVANTYTIGTVALQDRDNFLASRDIVDYARRRGWYDPATDGPFDFAAAYANPQSASHPSNTGRQWSGLTCVTDRRIEPGPDLPFSVVPRQKLSVIDAMRILRHDKRNETPAIPPDSRLVCALCSGGTQTSFVTQMRRDLPRDIGIVYWACLASPRTSFYVPFHFGITDFPTGWRLDSERPAKAYYDRRVQAPFAANPLEAFWTFSNFRDRVADEDPAAVEAAQKRARDLERHALELQGPIERAARQLYETDRPAAARLLENYSKRVYVASLEAMGAVLPEE
ncbi:MAG: C69 family dipeptidase [Sedimentisphaerales bacterium]|nr:C69 family dipeptidase [Sedimentisphaerales bacterium]